MLAEQVTRLKYDTPAGEKTMQPGLLGQVIEGGIIADKSPILRGARRNRGRGIEAKTHHPDPPRDKAVLNRSAQTNRDIGDATVKSH